jgi:hypothetical protein
MTLLTIVVLVVALSTSAIGIVEILFNSHVSISYLEIVAMFPFFALFLIVACKLKVNPILIKCCVWASRTIVKSLYLVVGFCMGLLLANLFYGHMNDATFFAIVGFTTYFVALATDWMLLDLENQSMQLALRNTNN